ncbi:hypothetical protein RUND412_006649 [Rhizina undulata]
MLVEPAPLIFTGLVPPPNTRPLHESASVIRARNKPFERLFSVSRIFYAIIYDLPQSSQRSLCRTTLAISREFQIRRAEARIRKEKLEHIFSLPPLLHIITEELFTPDVRNLSLVTLSLSRSLLGQPVAWRNVLYEFSRPAVGRALESPWDIKLLRDQCKSARAGRQCKSFQNSTTTRPLAPVREDHEMFHVRFLRKMNLQFQLQAITRLDLDETGFGFDVVSGIVKAGARLKFLSVRHCRNVRTWEIAKLLGLEVGYRDYILPPAPPMGFEVAPMLKYFEQEREFLSYNGPVLDRLEGLQDLCFKPTSPPGTGKSQSAPRRCVKNESSSASTVGSEKLEAYALDAWKKPGGYQSGVRRRKARENKGEVRVFAGVVRDGSAGRTHAVYLRPVRHVGQPAQVLAVKLVPRAYHPVVFVPAKLAMNTTPWKSTRSVPCVPIRYAENAYTIPSTN